MTVYGCINAYNEADTIEDCAKALRSYTDKIIVVDGAYKAYPHTCPRSNNGTLEIMRSAADIFISKARAWKDEVEKRNAYLIGEPGDWYIVNDADEIIKGELDKSILHSNAIGYQMWIKRPNLPRSPIFRIFRHLEGVEYRYAHCLLWSPMTGPIRPDNMPIIDNPMFDHYTDSRSDERKRDKGVYYRWLQEYEAKARKKYNL